jgi:elongation factor 1 alpha-like protein
MKISDVPPPKSKGLDVVKEFEASTTKRSISFVVVGKGQVSLPASRSQY